MAQNTTIEWTRGDDGTPGKSWNPVTGCTKISQGCKHCYAEAIAERFRGTKTFPNGFDVTLHPERLGQPLHWRKPRRIFVNSMSDLFHEDIPADFIQSVWDVMVEADWHTYQILTKRPERMLAVVPHLRYPIGTKWMDGPAVHIWLGVSCEDQATADLRIPLLLQVPAAIRFLSCEPLLAPVSLEAFQPFTGALNNGYRAARGILGGHIHWVIVGGESGPGARPMHPAWVRSIRDQCLAAGVPFFYKQWGAWAPACDHEEPDNHMRAIDRNGWELEYMMLSDYDAGAEVMARVGKKKAGRLLDGRTWDQFPT